jgi:hypothetical protein
MKKTNEDEPPRRGAWRVERREKGEGRREIRPQRREKDD